jgi:hypothetical protein
MESNVWDRKSWKLRTEELMSSINWKNLRPKIYTIIETSTDKSCGTEWRARSFWMPFKLEQFCFLRRHENPRQWGHNSLAGLWWDTRSLEAEPNWRGGQFSKAEIELDIKRNYLAEIIWASSRSQCWKSIDIEGLTEWPDLTICLLEIDPATRGATRTPNTIHVRELEFQKGRTFSWLSMVFDKRRKDGREVRWAI